MAVEQREAARGETVIHNDHDAIHFLGVYRELVGRRLFVVALLVVAGSTLVGATR